METEVDRRAAFGPKNEEIAGLTDAPSTATADAIDSTADAAYARRLVLLQEARWKRLLHVQAIYGWKLRQLRPGKTLEIGCGIGRNLLHLRGAGVGIDHNRFCVGYARQRGLAAFTPDQFRAAYRDQATFSSLLLSHVVEHLTVAGAIDLVAAYLPYLAPGARLLVITPQERGQASDPTHITFVDRPTLERIADALGYRIAQHESFPLPRFCGRWFIYNELVTVLDRP
jgi:SAM-dependent methyltransferase